MKSLKSESGFTLIELITVIVIIGIVAVTVIVRYQDFSKRVKANACRSNQIALEQAQIMFYSVKALQGQPNYAGSMSELLPYLTSATSPECQAGGSYTLSEDGTVSCSLPGHARDNR